MQFFSLFYEAGAMPGWLREKIFFATEVTEYTEGIKRKAGTKSVCHWRLASVALLTWYPFRTGKIPVAHGEAQQ